jgi:cation transport ATPase
MLGVYFMIGNMLFPILPSLKEFYTECVTFPEKFGIYTFSVILNILITIYVILKYAKALIWRAFMNFKSFRVTNMETLIALGSLSAFSLFVYFIFKHSIDFFSGNLVHRHQAIMDINSSLSSASIIVLVVTIGKYF